MESFSIAVNAVMPFLIYIIMGYGIRRIGMVDEAFMNKLNQLVFKVFFPILMFNNLYQTERGFSLNLQLVLCGVGSLGILILILFLAVPRIVQGNPQRGVLIQAIYRSNFVLFAIPLTISLFGEEQAAAVSMMVAIVVPIYNIVAVAVLEYFRGGKVKASRLIQNICKNPLIVGAIIGGIFFAFQIKIPACVEKPLSQLSTATTPLALLVLGSTLHFDSVKKNARYLVPALGIKMILLPAIALVISKIAGLSDVETFIMFAMYATPIAASSYPMAQNMGGDGTLAGEFVVVSTALSVFTMFLWIFAMKGLGII